MQQDYQQMGQKVTAWYIANRRDLPWRRTEDPYRIWLSEIMLQQTRVDTVIDYYHRFVARFPDAAALAKAEEEEVLALWAGLGYYSRARNLHQAARQIVQNHEGKFPHLYEDIIKLPGIGDYTTAAIMSIAFHQPYPAVDGNVKRVVSRLGEIGNVSGATALRQIKAFVEKMIPLDQANSFTQAMMELGALICLPRSQQCSHCPLSSDCQAFQKGHPEDYPHPSRSRLDLKEIQYVVALIIKDEKILMHFREQETLLARMWGLPMAECTDGASAATLFYNAYHLILHEPQAIGSVSHTFSHQKWHMQLYRYSLDPNCALHPDLRWWSISKISELAIPTAFKKALAFDRGQTPVE